jgi:LDH2 family malate/lactate/ureidoglycolate dehydrogenase
VTVWTSDQLHAFSSEMLRTLGMPEEDARIVADSWVWAGLRDEMGHSVWRLVQIAQRSRAGGLALKVDWAPVHTFGAVTQLDAQHAWGTIGAARGMRHAIEAARRFGVGMTSVRNCDNTGALGMHTAHAIAAGMIGIAIGKTVPDMAVWGARKSVVGDQPIAVGAPAKRHRAFSLDVSLGAEKVAVLREAAAAGRQLPPNTILSASGAPTTDASEYAKGGTMLPIGGHRGSGIAIAWEVLTGVLSGGLILSEVLPLSRLEAPRGISLFLLAIDPAALMPREQFLERMDKLIDEIHAAPPMDGVDRVRLPGERRERIAEERKVSGIPIADEDLAEIASLAKELGVRVPGT